MEPKNTLIIIAGPTASGKTALSVELAKRIGGEVISADSMQVYRHMDVGSAKVTAEETCGIPHHLIDVLNPTEDFNVVVFQQMAKKAMQEIWDRGHIPIVCGGTGFYVQALVRDIDFTETEEDSALRSELEETAKREGAEALHRILEEIDPESAEAIHPNNVKRMIRAIEFHRQTGIPISEHNRREREKTSPYRCFYYVLNMDRPVLYDRINRRVDLMMENGLLEETRKLRDMGCKRESTAMQGLGYKEMMAYLDGETDLETTVDDIKENTRHFAKRQLTWFRREKDVRWIWLPDYPNGAPEIAEMIEREIEAVK